MDVSQLKGFDRDEENQHKSWEKHSVSTSEAEEVFFNEPLVLPDETHSEEEQRFYAIGVTQSGRTLFISFTVRGEYIRVISARDSNRKERKTYYEFTKEENT